MDPAWPMYCHDVRHTGRSPYSTAGNHGTEKWRFGIGDIVWGGPVIDYEGIIYVGAETLYAFYLNGTLKWKYDGWIRTEASAPAIDGNGVLYVGNIWGSTCLYAIYTYNGTLKWKFPAGGIWSSPAIGNDGSIYFGSDDNYIYALYSDGTLKWAYKTGLVVYSSPAIGLDGTIYCGSHDGNLYAFYPDNGTLKWKYQTGDWIGRGPCIADDGTIYFGSWDGYLYAVYPNGTLKWKTGGYLCGTTPVIGDDGTIYVGNKQLCAIYPENGAIKWSFNLDDNEDIRGSNPCISADGTIYFGTFGGSKIYAVNSDGTLKWRKSIGGDIVSAPAIGEDGTVYIGDGRDDGYLHAFGPLDPSAPSTPNINGPSSGKAGTSYEYTFKSTSPVGRGVYYYIDWGDDTVTDWFGPYTSGQTVAVNHTWTAKGTYTVQARAKDTDNLWGPWGTLDVTMPKIKTLTNPLFLRFLEHFPLLEKLFSKFLN